MTLSNTRNENGHRANGDLKNYLPISIMTSFEHDVKSDYESALTELESARQELSVAKANFEQVSSELLSVDLDQTTIVEEIARLQQALLLPQAV